jgi:hypothetical protein
MPRKFRIEVADPTPEESRIDIIDSSFVEPNTLNPEPNRVNDLILVPEVTTRKSNIDKPLPRREIPYTEWLLPSLDMPLTDSEEEKLTSSSTESIEEILAMP